MSGHPSPPNWALCPPRPGSDGKTRRYWIGGQWHETSDRMVIESLERYWSDVSAYRDLPFWKRWTRRRPEFVGAPYP